MPDHYLGARHPTFVGRKPPVTKTKQDRERGGRGPMKLRKDRRTKSALLDILDLPSLQEIRENPGDAGRQVTETALLGHAAKALKLGKPVVTAAKAAMNKALASQTGMLAPVGAIFSKIGKKRYESEAANMTRVSARSHKENLAKIDKASPKDRAEAITRTDVEDLDHLDKVGAESVKTPRSSARRKVAEVANALRAPGTKQHKQDTFKRDEFIRKISGGGKVTGKQLTGLAEDVHSDVIRDPGKVGTVTSAVDDFIKAAKVKKRKK